MKTPGKKCESYGNGSSLVNSMDLNDDCFIWKLGIYWNGNIKDMNRVIFMSF